MKKLTAIFIVVLLVSIGPVAPTAKAEEHGVADGSCDPLCAAENECRSYVDTIDIKEIFYLVVAESDRMLVQTYCKYGPNHTGGLQI